MELDESAVCLETPSSRQALVATSSNPNGACGLKSTATARGLADRTLMKSRLVPFQTSMHIRRSRHCIDTSVLRLS